MKKDTGNRKTQWIWLNKEIYPEYQKTFCNTWDGRGDGGYCVAEFKKTIQADEVPVKVELRVSGDTFFRLYADERLVGVGPVCAGGDFLLNEPLSVHYANNYTIFPSGGSLELFAQVRLSPVVLTDYSQGHGGLFLTCTLYYKDGSTETIGTDETWLCRLNRKFTAPYTFDNTLTEDDWSPAAVTPDIWPLEDPSIPMLSETTVLPESPAPIVFAPNSVSTATVTFDRIYAGYVLLDIKTEGDCEINVTCVEIPGQGGTNEQIRTDRPLLFRSFQMHSIGGYEITVNNRGGQPVVILPSLQFTCYPVETEGSFICSDSELNKVYDVCKWTLQICRQTIHLDSPRHQELLACTGDYYIESLMEAFCFGDMRLAEMDILRTAKVLLQNHGRMFHTTYSLIWVQMLRDVYMFTGNRSLVETCMPALHLLLERFHGYLGDNGLIENPPDYMFVDWMVVDGYSLHHPPKALGQTCLNAFYHGALRTAAELCELASEPEKVTLYTQRADALRVAHNKNLYDTTRGLYFDGLNTPHGESRWLPANSVKRYYSKHGNTLSVLYGLCDEKTGQAIMEKVVNSEELTDVQPYFMHFVLEALDRVGLFEKYGLRLLDRYKPMIAACDKGLQEGWHKPEETYSFDHSHAWGGTPAYQLPSRLMGFTMVEPGFRKIHLNPNLYGLEWADIAMPTPRGMLRCSYRKGEAPRIKVPEGIDYEWE